MKRLESGFFDSFRVCREQPQPSTTLAFFIMPIRLLTVVFCATGFSCGDCPCAVIAREKGSSSARSAKMYFCLDIDLFITDELANKRYASAFGVFPDLFDNTDCQSQRAATIFSAGLYRRTLKRRQEGLNLQFQRFAALDFEHTIFKFRLARGGVSYADKVSFLRGVIN